MAVEGCSNGKVHYLLPILHKADGGQVAKQDILNVDKSKLLPAASLFTLTSDCCHCLAYISFTCHLYLLRPELKLSRTFCLSASNIGLKLCFSRRLSLRP